MTFSSFTPFITVFALPAVRRSTMNNTKFHFFFQGLKKKEKKSIRLTLSHVEFVLVSNWARTWTQRKMIKNAFDFVSICILIPPTFLGISWFVPNWVYLRKHSQKKSLDHLGKVLKFYFSQEHRIVLIVPGLLRLAALYGIVQQRVMLSSWQEGHRTVWNSGLEGGPRRWTWSLRGSLGARFRHVLLVYEVIVHLDSQILDRHLQSDGHTLDWNNPWEPIFVFSFEHDGLRLTLLLGSDGCTGRCRAVTLSFIS